MKLFIISNLYNKSLFFIRKIYFQIKKRTFDYFRKRTFNAEVSSGHKQTEFDKKLVRSLSKSRIPSLKQIKYAGKVLSKRELLVLRLSFFVLFFSFIFWGGFFYFSHLQTVPVKGGVYKEAIVGAPKYINPLYSSLSDVDSDLESLIFSSLYKRGSNCELKQDLVTDLSISEDAKTYTIKITDKAIWHDNQVLTSNDIVFTFDAIKNTLYKSTLKSSFEGVEIEAVNDYEFKFILTEPYAAFLDLLTFGILPAHLWSQVPPSSAQLAELNLKPVGSGPFKFESLAKDKNGTIKEYKLLVNETYYSTPPLIELEFYFYNVIEEAIEALNSQVVNGISYLPFDRKDSILTPNSFSFEKLHLPQLTLIFFNQKNNVSLQDKAVRQALSYAIDRNAVVNDVLKGNAYLADGPILNDNFAYFAEIKKYDYRPEEASRLLDSIDWKTIEISDEQVELAKLETEEEERQKENAKILEMGSGTWRIKDGNYLTVNLKTVDRGENVEIIRRVSSYWEALGVKVTIDVIDVTNIQNEVIRPRNFEAFFYGQILGSDPDPYAFWHSSQTGENGYNIANFISKEVDALLEDARQNSDLTFRQEKYKKFQEIIAEEQPAIFMYSPVYTYVYFNKLKGFDVGSILLPRNRFSNIEDWYIKVGKRFILDQVSN